MGWNGSRSTSTEVLLACCASPEWQIMIIVDQSVDWMIDRGNWSTWRKLAPVPLCPTQIPHDLVWVRTQTAAVKRRRLTAWATWHPFCDGTILSVDHLFSHILWNPKFPCRVHKNLLQAPNQTQKNSDHTHGTYNFKEHLNIIFTFTSRPDQKFHSFRLCN